MFLRVKMNGYMIFAIGKVFSEREYRLLPTLILAEDTSATHLRIKYAQNPGSLISTFLRLLL